MISRYCCASHEHKNKADGAESDVKMSLSLPHRNDISIYIVRPSGLQSARTQPCIKLQTRNLRSRFCIQRIVTSRSWAKCSHIQHTCTKWLIPCSRALL